jgi:16S rRNA (adenine1518-N6/adenine1519-N6)-dimethyltransferase
MTPRSARFMLRKYGLAPSRERGQNFLTDANVAARIVDAVGAGAGDVVVEVGPGFGAVTFGLAAACRHVIAVELDGGIARAFRGEYGRPERVTLVDGDILDFDFREAARAEGVEKLIVAGNLPYGVTSPLLGRLVESEDAIERAVVLVQREVADRMTAAPGSADYGALTAVLGFHATLKPFFVVRRTCFYPAPEVDARLVEIDFRRTSPRGVDPELYARIVHAAFGQRRKMLRRSLASLAEREGILLAVLEERSGIDLERRGETLGVSEFESLAEVMGGDARGPQ